MADNATVEFNNLDYAWEGITADTGTEINVRESVAKHLPVLKLLKFYGFNSASIKDAYINTLSTKQNRKYVRKWLLHENYKSVVGPDSYSFDEIYYQEYCLRHCIFETYPELEDIPERLNHIAEYIYKMDKNIIVNRLQEFQFELDALAVKYWDTHNYTPFERSPIAKLGFGEYLSHVLSCKGICFIGDLRVLIDLESYVIDDTELYDDSVKAISDILNIAIEDASYLLTKFRACVITHDEVSKFINNLN